MSSLSRSKPAVWSVRHQPTGRMQRIFGPLYITGIAWFGLCHVFCRWVPYRINILLSYPATLIAELLLQRVRRGITSNLDVVLGEVGVFERERRIYRTLRMFALVTIDRYTMFHYRDRLQFEVENGDHWQAALAGDRGCVLVNAHLGNWEATSLAPGTVNDDMHVHIVREEEVDARSHALLKRLYKNYESSRFHLHYAGDVSSLGVTLLMALRKGGVVGLAGDQPRMGQGFVEVEMFGRRTPVPHGPAALARAAGVALLPVFAVRVGSMRYRIIVCEPVEVLRTDDRERDVFEATQGYARHLEAVIRRYPHSWYCWWPRWQDESVGEPEAASDSSAEA